MSTLKFVVSEEDHIQGPTLPTTPGPEEGICTLVEYGDYECPHCRIANPIVKRIEHHFKGKLRFVFRNFPLTQVHPHAQAAAETAEFAATQGKFWEMHDLLFKHQERLGYDLFTELATELGFDLNAFQQALNEGAFTRRVRDDFTGGVRSGVNGTPTFFVNGRRHNGPYEYDSLVAKIEEALNS